MFTLVIFAVIFLISFLWQQWKFIPIIKSLPGPFPIPFIGSALAWMKMSEVVQYFDRLSSTYGSPFRLFVGPQPIVYISDAKNAKIVLNSKDCLNKPDLFYKVFRESLSVDGLITLNVEKWKLHRRLIRPELSLSSVSVHLDLFNRCIKNTIETITINKAIDIVEPIIMCMLTIFIEASLGNDLDYNAKQKYLQNFTDGMRIMAERMTQPFYHLNFIWKLTKSYKILTNYQKYGRNLFTKVMNDKSKSTDDGYSFIERLFNIAQRNQQFTQDDVLNETVTILGGASDTTSLGISFAVLMLAMHPKYQEKVYEEMLTVMPDPNMNLTHDDLTKLKFTDLCIRETLRLFPIVPIIGRYSTKPLKLSNGIVVPENVPIMIGLRQIATQEEYFGPTALEFNPNRFVDKSFLNGTQTANIPFSYGARNCIGYFYAQIVMKLFIAHLIRNYQLTTNYKSMNELKIMFMVGLRLVDKHMVKLSRRN